MNEVEIFPFQGEHVNMFLRIRKCCLFNGMGERYETVRNSASSESKDRSESFTNILGVAFQTAVALAEYRFVNQTDKEPGDRAQLEEEDFSNVCDMAGAFRNYLKDVAMGLDEDQRAANERSRNDLRG
jgi:hypothetical protein